jgi:hypothetical protein
MDRCAGTSVTGVVGRAVAPRSGAAWAGWAVAARAAAGRSGADRAVWAGWAVADWAAGLSGAG